jgi:transposase InsO family protein
MPTIREDRYTAIHLLRAGHSVEQVAKQLKRTPQWVRKWRKRYENEDWQGLASQSRAPKKHGRRLPESVRQLVAQTRSELEAEAALGTGLKYIGARAIRTRLQDKPNALRPSVATIERILREKEMSQPRCKPTLPKIAYPHLQPTQAHELYQVDIVPHFLTGGERVACFNAIDVVSRNPTGQAYARRRSQDAAEFLIYVWQTLGIPRYTQIDNESCFSGGFTHKHVLGKVVRLALQVGTELVFSPVRHPESNGYVERFHQDYDKHVWEDTYLESQQVVQQQAEHFFQLYRHSRHHSRLNEQTPFEVHYQAAPHCLAADFQLSPSKLPLYEGRVHFIRRVHPDATVSVLNVTWQVPNPPLGRGVWVTVDLRCEGATLAIYDAPPDVAERTCLVTYDFSLSEPVQPRVLHHVTDEGKTVNEALSPPLGDVAIKSTVSLAQSCQMESLRWCASGLATFNHSTRLATQLLSETMY